MVCGLAFMSADSWYAHEQEYCGCHPGYQSRRGVSSGFSDPKGYPVLRRMSLLKTGRVVHPYAGPQEHGGSLALHYRDMTYSSRLLSIGERARLDDVYNLAALSHVAVPHPVLSRKFGACG